MPFITTKAELWAARVACAQDAIQGPAGCENKDIGQHDTVAIGPGEVDQIGAGSRVGARRILREKRFATLEPADAPCSAEFCDGVIKIVISVGAAAAWASDETQVGIYETLALSTGSLELSIEKDFECLEPRRGENQSNRFKNPKNVI